MKDPMDKPTRELRSRAWFERSGQNAFVYHSWMKNQGFPKDLFEGRPVIGSCNTWSELTPGNPHPRDPAERVRRGVYEAGGFSVEFPVTSLGESNMRPTAMLFRNLASMDVEESIRANPIDGVILLVGCDKTKPALLMGAASCDLPTIAVSGGPMLSGHHHGEIIGSGTAVWRLHEELKAGHIMTEDFLDADARRQVLAQMTGRRIVDLVREGVTLSQILTPAAFANAIRTNAAIGGSTNAPIHLITIAGRIGVSLTLAGWDRLGRDVPTLVDLMPSGSFLMEDFYYAGGLPVVLRALLERGLIDGSALTVNGCTLGDNVATAENVELEAIRAWNNPLVASGGLAVLRGNLAPNGAVIKPSAAAPALMRHSGRAVVFEDFDDYHARTEDPGLDVDANSVMVLKNCGPRGFSGMAKVGNMGLPSKLLKQGVTDMARISNARMSGTACGTVVLHAAPEAAVSGNLALVQNGDLIELDAEARGLVLAVDDAELARRRAAWRPRERKPGGYASLYMDHVPQADQGCDFEFRVGCRGAGVPAHSH